jgi:hypothetical protein
MAGQLEAALHSVKSGRPLGQVGRSFSFIESPRRLKTERTNTSQLGRNVTFREKQSEECEKTEENE